MGEVTVQDDGSFVIDQAALLDPATEDKLEAWLKELERKTTAQVKLLTVKTTDGEDVFSFGHRHAELWKLGQLKPGDRVRFRRLTRRQANVMQATQDAAIATLAAPAQAALP
ncbi:MAG: TPM domain-containing protein, partial [Planctomycetes bacterium]|nr:TPM domain-containing protein [Planctomycetota bacterium]